MTDADFERVDVDEQETQILFLRRQDDLIDSVTAELAEWAQIKPPDESSRSALDALLSLDGLVTAATSGVIGGAAWSIFPAAARWVKERSAKQPATPEEILNIVRSCLDDVEPGISSRLKVNNLTHDHGGSWRGTFQTGRRIYQVVVDQAGDVVAIDVQTIVRLTHG
jgi:hypothetical protein